MNWEFDSIRDELAPFNWEKPVQYSEQMQAYLDFYDIDFISAFSSVTHYWGWLATPSGNVSCHCWLQPSETHKGVIFIWHGYFDHVGVYGHAIRYFLSQGYSVMMYDMIGHGLSDGERATIESFEQYRDAIDIAVVQAKHLPRPWHAIGQSTGAGVLKGYLLQYKTDPFDKIVLLAPLLRAARWPMVISAHRMFAKVLSRVRRNVPEFDDWDFPQIIKQDPLQGEWIPVPWISAMIDWQRYLLNQPVCDRPILVLQGDNDLTVDAENNIPRIKTLFPQSETIWFQDCRHNMVNETPAMRERIFETIDNYLK